uniref:Uncharacterized protein n=1 Tax=Meloidogyne incognita TaxID=6306 RepID=A0A914LHQ4_MELIC
MSETNKGLLINRKDCYHYRDLYFDCLEKNNEDKNRCHREFEKFSDVCQSTWVVLFTDVMQSSIKDLSEIDPKWLEQIAPHYYEFGSDLQGTKRRKIDDNNFAEGRMANLN